jgi:hypothetical protein
MCKGVLGVVEGMGMGCGEDGEIGVEVEVGMEVGRGT